MVDQGMSTEEIRAALEQRSDHDLTGEPSTMLDGVLPALVTLAALLLLIFLLRAMVRSRREEIRQMPESKKDVEELEPKQTSAKTSDEQLDARLREELDNLEDDSLDDR